MPATTAQIEANRVNAQASTGPVTAEGKAAAARNATKHGLSSASGRAVTLSDEERAAFAELEASLRDELKPEGALGNIVFGRIVNAAWNMDRCERIQATLALSGVDPLTDPAHHATIRLMETYFKRNERTFNLAIKQLRELQLEQIFREGVLSAEEVANPSIPALVPVARLRRQYADDECSAARSEAATIRRKYDPAFAELRFSELKTAAAAASNSAAPTTAPKAA